MVEKTAIIKELNKKIKMKRGNTEIVVEEVCVGEEHCKEGEEEDNASINKSI